MYDVLCTCTYGIGFPHCTFTIIELLVRTETSSHVSRAYLDDVHMYLYVRCTMYLYVRGSTYYMYLVRMYEYIPIKKYPQYSYLPGQIVLPLLLCITSIYMSYLVPCSCIVVYSYLSRSLVGNTTCMDDLCSCAVVL